MYFVTLLLEFNRPSQKLPEANKRLMVYIGPGAFTMGGRYEDSPRNEQPAHSITLSGYYIGTTPVTNQEYREFVQCTGYKAPIHWQRGTFPHRGREAPGRKCILA